MPQIDDLFIDWQRANRARHEAEHAEEVARMRLEMARQGGNVGNGVETLTHAEAAKQVKRSTKTMIRWIREGKLKADKPKGTRKYIINRAAWDRFCAANELEAR